MCANNTNEYYRKTELLSYNILRNNMLRQVCQLPLPSSLGSSSLSLGFAHLPENTTADTKSNNYKPNTESTKRKSQ